MASDTVLALAGAAVVTGIMVALCHYRMQCGQCGETKVDNGTTVTPVRRDAGDTFAYRFNNAGGAFRVVLRERSGAFPQTPALTLFVDASGQATVSSAKTIYKPRIRRHHARYAQDVPVPVGVPHTFWLTYDVHDGLQLGLGTSPGAESTLLVADTYMPLGSFSCEVQGPGVEALTPITPPTRGSPVCRYRLRKPYE